MQCVQRGMMLLLCWLAPALALGSPGVPEPVPLVLSDEFQALCQRPCEHLGFSFSGPEEELAEMRAAGANTVGLGSMWNPVPDPSAPDGCGVVSPVGTGVLGQSFTADVPFDGFAPCLPTGTSTDSGCSWRLLRVAAAGTREVAAGRWTRVRDNSFPEARFAVQPAGRYRFEILRATGTWIGWWQRDDVYPGGNAWQSGKPIPARDFECRLHAGGGWRDLVAPAEPHSAVHLGPSPFVLLRRMGFVGSYAVGEWNNPGFPYYPDWFVERFPDIAALDQDGRPFLGGMFGRQVPAPGIEHPVIVDGASRHIRETAAALRDEPALLSWVMGGEAMYATYGNGTRWTDYSARSLRHFRAFLRRRYGAESAGQDKAAREREAVAALNRAWGSSFTAMADVMPPRAPEVSRAWLDWLDFRFTSMGERFGWHYQAIRAEDRRRLALTCNHGDIYHGNEYAAMGARPELYAANSDGFETGQIMTDNDPDLFNVMYVETLTTFGKPYCPVRLAYKKSDPGARGGGRSYTPEAARRYVYESLGADAWHLGLIQWSGSLPDGEWGVKGTPAEKAIARVFGEVRRLRPYLDEMHAARPRLGVFLSHPTWALLGFRPSWTAFHVAAVERHVPKRYVYDGQVLGGQVADYPVLLSLDNEIVDEAVEKALFRYVQRGGTLVVAGAFGTREIPPPVRRPEAGPVQRVPRTPGVHRVGRGRVVVLTSATPASILAALPASARGISLTARERAVRIKEVHVARGGTDWPADLAGHTSLGQTVVLPRSGLCRVAICMPTYWKTPPAGFTFSVRRGGPGGEIVATRHVPHGIGDNSWVDLAVPERALRAGETAYIEAVPDATLPESHLGWWSTRTDVYPNGQAWEDGAPVAGDRQVILSFAEPVPGEQAVEAFLLSDGLNAGVVLVNTSGTAVTLSVDLRNALPPDARDVTVACPLAPDAWRGSGMRGTVRLPAHGTAFLYARNGGAARSARALVDAAQGAILVWRRRQAAPAHRVVLAARAASYLRAGRPDKAAAVAARVLHGLGVAVQSPASVPASGTLAITVRFYDAAGAPCDPDRAWAEFVPSPAFQQPLTRTGRGCYALRLPVSRLPARYDYRRGAYVPFHGPLRVRLAGVLRARSAVEVLDLEVGRG